MISMKLTPAEAKSDSMLCGSDVSDSDLPEYPYGLTISLDDESLSKLSMGEMPAVGTVMQLTALVKVCGVSQYENQQGSDSNLSLQITDMELANGNAEPRPIANRIYGGA